MGDIKRIKNAIIIHGPGRSGTTLLSSILSLHEDLGWISGYVNKHPRLTFLSCLNRLQSFSWFERWNRGKRRFPRPSEAYNFWSHYIPEFEDRNLNAISSTSSENCKKAIGRILRSTSKKRFITKITGYSRFHSIDAPFDDPLIIWIDRDPKSVIMSYYKQRWHYKNDIETFNAKPKKELIEEYTAFYKKFQEDKSQLQKFRMLNIEYEDLVENRQEVFKEICNFTKLPYTKKFDAIVNSWKIKKGSNLGYKNYLNDDEEAYLNKLITD